MNTDCTSSCHFFIISCGYTHLLPEVTLWVITLGLDQFGFPIRFSPPVTLQITTQGQLLTWQYLGGNLIHHGELNYGYLEQRQVKYTHCEPRKLAMFDA